MRSLDLAPASGSCTHEDEGVGQLDAGGWRAKVNKRNKKGPGDVGLPAAIQLEIREDFEGLW